MEPHQDATIDLADTHVAILGMGRLGRALHAALDPLCRLTTTWNRTQPSTAAHLFPTALASADIVFLAVSDAAIAPMARALAEASCLQAPQVVLHCAGRSPSSILAPLQDRGCNTGSLHPLQPITQRAKGTRLFANIRVGIEGTPQASAAARMIAESLGGTVFSLENVDRTAYHAAAVFASNYTITLAHIGAELLAKAGVTDPALPLLLPLMQASITNLTELGLPQALTGPISRADVDTVTAHIDILTPTQEALYRHLARATLPIAQAQKGAGAKEWRALEDALREPKPD